MTSQLDALQALLDDLVARSSRLTALHVDGLEDGVLTLSGMATCHVVVHELTQRLPRIARSLAPVEVVDSRVIVLDEPVESSAPLGYAEEETSLLRFARSEGS